MLRQIGAHAWAVFWNAVQECAKGMFQMICRLVLVSLAMA